MSLRLLQMTKVKLRGAISKSRKFLIRTERTMEPSRGVAGRLAPAPRRRRAKACDPSSAAKHTVLDAEYWHPSVPVQLAKVSSRCCSIAQRSQKLRMAPCRKPRMAGDHN
jgi:hypothetical protein